ncbi:MAG TPA: hypothetical protein VHC39_05440, partial [Rhizomicrobium sp.]|nr:hypothetical protein [Rhizomicrobium sp.]
MNHLTRRNLMLTGAMAGAAAARAFAQQGPNAPYNPHPAKRIGQPQEGPDTPKLTIYMNDLMDDEEAVRIKQLGINWIDTATVPEQPWGLDYLQPRVDALKKHDMHVGIMMIRWSYKGGMDPEMSKIVY